jgi:elongation factor G
MKNGVLAGYQMDSMSVELLDGSFHPVDSDQLSFELAAKMAYRSAVKDASQRFSSP